MLKKILLGSCAALILSGCASTPTRRALDTDAKKGLATTKAHLHVAQDEIIVRAESSNITAAMGGGLIWALIDSSVAKGRQGTVQTQITPFYSAVDDVDVRKRLQAALAKALGEGAAIKVDATEASAIGLRGTELEKRRGAQAADQGLLQISSHYTFSPGYQRFVMSTHVDLWHGDKRDRVYGNDFVFQSAPVGPGGNDSLNAWSDNQGEQYRKAVDDAVAQTANMIRMDLAAGASEPAGGKPLTLTHYDFRGPRNVTGTVVDAPPGRAIVRDADGRLYSVAQ